MPSQSQVKWAQLRVGITVIAAVTVLAVLIFLMTGWVAFLRRRLLSTPFSIMRAAFVWARP